MRNRRRLKGFTLIEAVVAIAVIGILAGIASHIYSKIRKNVRIKQAEAYVEMLAASVQQLANDTGKWPGGHPREAEGNPEVWNLTTAGAGLLSADSSFMGWKGPYIHTIPNDPWGSPYFFDSDYSVNGVMKAVVGSFGPNKRGRNVYDSDNIYVILH